MKISLILAADKNGVIGVGNALPWKHRDDMRHFKKETVGKTLIMGRRTFESLPSILSERKLIVITSKECENLGDVIFVKSMNDAIRTAEKLGKDTCLVGGKSVYEKGLIFATDIIYTEMDTEVADDVTAVKTFTLEQLMSSDFWQLSGVKIFEKNEHNDHKAKVVSLTAKNYPHRVKAKTHGK